MTHYGKGYGLKKKKASPRFYTGILENSLDPSFFYICK